MPKQKKAHPVGICKVCHGITYRDEAVNQRCGSSPRGKRCTGVFSSARSHSDWKECTACAGTGKFDARLCVYCSGVGWNFVRPGGL